MAFLDFAKFARMPWTKTESLSRDGVDALMELDRRTRSVTTPAAASVTFVPTGGIAAANVQAALVELDTEKENTGAAAAAVAAHEAAPDPHPQYATDAALTAHTGDTGNPHVVTAAQVGAVAVNGAIVGATKTKITYDAKGLVTAGADATTADIADSANKRYVTDAQQTILTNTSGTNTGDETATSVGALIDAATSKATPVDADELGVADSAASFILKKLTWANLKATLKTYFDTLYMAAGGEATLANVTLSVAGISLASGSFAACKFLRIEIILAGYSGSDTASLRFNGDSGNNYRYHWTHILAAATALTAGLRATVTDRIKIASVNTTNSRRVTVFVENLSTVTEKVVTFSSGTGTGSTGTHGTTDFGNAAWVSGASTQITSVSLVSTSNMLAGTQMTIYGWN